MWRLTRVGPYGEGMQVVLGVTGELPDGGRVWFRVRLDGRGDGLSDDPVVAEVRDSDRARSRCEEVTGMYLANRWEVVDPPRARDLPDPPTEPEAVLDGGPLRLWASEVAGWT